MQKSNRYPAFIALALTGAAFAQQISLDAPLVQEQPSLRSEIKRGSGAAFDCGSQNTMAPAALSTCLFNASSANRGKMSQGYDPFDIGLMFRGWTEFSIMSSSLRSGNLAHDAANAESFEKIFWSAYIALRKKVGLTDDQVIDATGLTSRVKDMVTAAAAKYGD